MNSILKADIATNSQHQDVSRYTNEHVIRRMVTCSYLIFVKMNYYCLKPILN